MLLLYVLQGLNITAPYRPPDQKSNLIKNTKLTATMYNRMEGGTDEVAPLSKHNTVKAYGMRLGKAAEIRDIDNRWNRFHYSAAISPRKRAFGVHCTKGWMGQGSFSTKLSRESHSHRN
jgi:hypothetical protein